MFDLADLQNYRDVSLVDFDSSIKDLEYDVDNLGNVATLSEDVLEQGTVFVFDISEGEMDEFSENHVNLDNSVNLYDHRLNHFIEKMKLSDLLNAKNKEFDKTPTYVLFVIWVLIFVILLFILSLYIVEDSLNLNIFVKAIIGLLLLFVFYFFFDNVYRFLSRNS